MPKAYFDILTVLNDAKLNGVNLHFIPGNHDFWGREFLDETLFNKVYPEGVTLDIKGKRFLITHGDGLLSWDRGYRVLRSVMRNRVFVFLYRWLHPDIGYAIAKNFSRNDDYDRYSAEQKEKIVKELVPRAPKRSSFEYLFAPQALYVHRPSRFQSAYGSLKKCMSAFLAKCRPTP